MKKVSFLFIIFGCLVFILLSACSSGDTSSTPNEDSETPSDSTNNQQTESSSDTGNLEYPSNLAFGAAAQGGSWYPLAGAMAEKMSDVFTDASVNIIEGGAIANIVGIGQDQITVAFTNGEMIPVAESGGGEFGSPITNMKSVATLYPAAMHLVVREDSDIYTIEDFLGKRISAGNKGTSSEIALQQLLKIHGMSYDDIEIDYVGTGDAANLLRDNQLDVIALMLPAPVAVFEELATSIGVRMISLEQSTIDAMNNHNAGYLPYTIDGGIYTGISDDTSTFAAFVTMLVNENLMNDEAVYEFTKLLFENKENWSNITVTMSSFNEEFSIENMVGDLHPGAEKYYKEAGVLD